MNVRGAIVFQKRTVTPPTSPASGYGAVYLDPLDILRVKTSAGIDQEAIAARLLPTSANTTNWNNATSNGWYWSNAATNQPAGLATYCMGEVVAYDASWITQTVWDFTAVSTTAGLRWRRHSYSGSWGSWYQVIDGVGELDARYSSGSLAWGSPQTVTGTSPFTSTLTVVKFGNYVALEGAISRASGSSSSYAAAGTVPSGYRPALSQITFTGSFWNTALTWQININTSGVVSVRMSGVSAIDMSLTGLGYRV